MITEMFIEGYPVDVSEYLSTLLTMAIDDIKDFSSRNTTFSKTIVLPGTARNNQVFGNVFEMESVNPYDASLPNVLANFNAAKSAGCYIFQENMQVFKGVVRLLEIVIDRGRKEYEVAVFGELGGLVAALGNKKLEDLDFSAYDMNYTLANITASWDNAGGSGVYFPLMDYGNYSTDKHNWQYQTFRPALYLKEYIDKIFAAASYRYTCALFSTARFKSLVIPHAQKLLTKLTSLIADAFNGATQTVLNSATSTSSGAIAYNTFSGGLFNQSVDKKTFTYTGTNTVTHLDWSFAGNYMAQGTTVLRLYVRKNSTLYFYDGTGLQSANTMTGFSKTYPSISLTLATGDVLQFWCELMSGSGAYQLDITNTSFTIHTDAAVASPLAIGDSIVMNDALPKNILQVDFLASLLKLFNLYVVEDKFSENLLNITPYVDFYSTDPSTSVDWSLKLDRSQPVHIKPMSELNSRYYHFCFQADSDYYNDLYTKRYNQNYGDFIYDSAFDFTQDETKIELIFSGTPLVGYQGEDKIYSTIFKRTGTTTLVEENVDCNIRILQTKKILSVSSWNIMQGTTVLGSYTTYGYAGHLDDPNAPANDIHFGVPKELFFTLVSGALNVNQFNTYWSPYLAEITDKDSRLMSAMFRLNPADIYGLDFSKLVLVDGSLFRINKITDYNASNPDLCQVELLKVIQLLY